MPAGHYNFMIEQGATFFRSFNWQNLDRSPVSIVGYTARLQFRTEATSSVPLLTLSSASGGGITLVEPNIIEIRITASQTGAMKFERAVYDLKLTAPDGHVVRMLEGRVILSWAVTR